MLYYCVIPKSPSSLLIIMSDNLTRLGSESDALSALSIIQALVFLWLCWWIMQRLFHCMNGSQSAPTQPTVRVVIARFPANGRAPFLEHLKTIKWVVSGSNNFRSIFQHVSWSWNLTSHMLIFRIWEITQLKKQGFEGWNGLYMSVEVVHLKENHNLPKIF
jgi:hypothetical protein